MQIRTAKCGAIATSKQAPLYAPLFATLSAPLFATLLTGCATAAPASVPKDHMKSTTLTLQAQHSAAVAPGATLAFERMEDSRCPINARCITAGKIVYHFRLSRDGASETFILDAAAPPYQPRSLPGAQIALAPFDPPPARTTDTAALVHPVTLTITLNP